MADKIWVGTSTPGDWSVAANWSPSGVPVDGDDVYLRDSTQDLSAGLGQSAVELASLNIEQSYTGDIATESTFLQIGAQTVRIGFWSGIGTKPAGSGRINLDLQDTGTQTCNVIVFDTAASPSDDNRAPVRLLLAQSDSNVRIRAGGVSVCDDPDDTTTVGHVDLQGSNDDGSAPEVYVGPGTTATTLTCAGGSLLAFCGCTTLNADGGTITTEGAGAVTTANVYEGTFNSNASGTVGTLNLFGGISDFTGSSVPRTVTTTNAYIGATLIADKDVVTFTNKPAPAQGQSIATTWSAA